MREPWRNTFAHLHTFLGWDWVQAEYGHLDLVRRLKAKPLSLVVQMMERGVSAPLTSSAGRLCDAVAAALGISFDAVSYEARAAIRDASCKGELLREARRRRANRLDWSPLWRALLADLEARIEPPLIAAKLHAGMADTVAEAGAELARRQGCNAIVLCGGVFQNKLFLERVSEKAGAMGFKVLSPAQFPAGDGGIALGQAIRPVCPVARMSPANTDCCSSRPA